MMRLLHTLLISGSLLVHQQSTTTQKTSNVYICVSAGAKVYHQTKECKGLQACTHKIKEVTESEAINDYGRRLCKVCYK